MARAIACLLIGIAAGIVGGYAGLRLAGTSEQSIAAGTASVTVTPAASPGLDVISENPPGQLHYAAWSVPISLRVSMRSVNAGELVAAVVDQNGQRAQLVSDARHALGNAIARFALVAALGALICGLMAGLVLGLATSRMSVVMPVALIALIVCAGVLLVCAVQVTSHVTATIPTPRCEVPSAAAANAAAQTVLQGGTSPGAAATVALRAACDPQFASELQAALG